jgi:creatinine amidohydrolase/Fe(II)-dependent formamide hydrolase-like protein
MKYEELNYDVLTGLDKKEFVFIPVGSIEVHGPSLPFGSDTYVVNAFISLIESKIKSIIMNPVTYGYAAITKSINGTISIDLNTASAYMHDIIKSIIALGFEKIIILNIHKDNDLPIKLAIEQIFNEDNLPVLYINPYLDFSKFDESIFSSKDNSYKETSLILASLELLNRQYLAGKIRLPEYKHEKPDCLKKLLEISYVKYKFSNEMEHVNPEISASAEEGRKYINKVVDEIKLKINNLEEYISLLKSKTEKHEL